MGQAQGDRPPQDARRPARGKARILLVEDHTLLREGLRSLLGACAGFDVVGEAGDGLDAIDQATRLEPDLVIMDISMPKMTGLEALREITRRDPKIKVIALTMHNSEEHLRDALQAGVSGYVLKTISHAELITAIRRVLAGERYLSPEVAGPVIDGYLSGASTGETSAWGRLTAREREVIKLIAEGYTSREIAELLRISPSTIEKHRANLMQKLDLHSVSAVTAYAMKRGLLPG